MNTLTEVRQLRSELLALGDYGSAELLAKADRCFSAWKFDSGYLWLERALEERLCELRPARHRRVEKNT